MAVLLRDAAANFSRRAEGYEPLDQTGEKEKEINILGRRALSRRSNASQKMEALFSVHHKRERAKHRQIFLRTYKLSSAVGAVNIGGKRRSSAKKEKLKKMAVKVRKVLVSVVGFMRNIGSLRSTCNSPSAISAASPTPIRRCC